MNNDIKPNKTTFGKTLAHYGVICEFKGHVWKESINKYGIPHTSCERCPSTLRDGVVYSHRSEKEDIVHFFGILVVAAIFGISLIIIINLFT